MFFQIIIATTIGGILSLVGGIVLLWRENLARRFSLTLVSFAVGGLLGAAFLELIPEAIGEIGFQSIAPAIILGIVSFFLFEKVLKWYHCHDQEKCDYHSFSSTVLAGDALHNFVDGLAIAISFSAGTAAGFATAVATFFHEIPQEMGDFGVLLHAGYSKTKVLVYNVLTALAAILGAIVGYLLLPVISPYLGIVLAFIAGSFIYIAVSDLLPELRHQTKGGDFGHLVSMVLGILIVWWLGIIIPE